MSVIPVNNRGLKRPAQVRVYEEIFIQFKSKQILMDDKLTNILDGLDAIKIHLIKINLRKKMNCTKRQLIS